MKTRFKDFLNESTEEYETFYIPDFTPVYKGKILNQLEFDEINEVFDEINHMMKNKIVEFEYDLYILGEYDENNKWYKIRKENGIEKDYLYAVYPQPSGKVWPKGEDLRDDPEYKRIVGVNILAQGNKGTYFIKPDQTVKIYKSSPEQKSIDPYGEEEWEDDKLLNRRMVNAIKGGLFGSRDDFKSGSLNKWMKKYSY